MGRSSIRRFMSETAGLTVRPLSGNLKMSQFLIRWLPLAEDNLNEMAST